ncbi:MAG TPA: SRPBCC family protein [Gemmatimonadales bacterium]|jgi:ribosome-associated toxin RatA of RatAB toxin-antitoxin module
MRTVDQIRVAAPAEAVFHAAADVEQWPRLLNHYRWVRMLERGEQGGLVEMAAWRPFGRLKYPTWWVSEMRVDRPALAIHYRHVRGITTGMDVVWQFQAVEGGTGVTIVHEWPGPRWPLVGRAAANWVIGPVFIHGIASRTLSGIAKYVENGGAAGQRGSA